MVDEMEFVSRVIAPRFEKKTIEKCPATSLHLETIKYILPVYFSKIDLLNKCYNHNQMFILIH